MTVGDASAAPRPHTTRYSKGLVCIVTPWISNGEGGMTGMGSLYAG